MARRRQRGAVVVRVIVLADLAGLVGRLLPDLLGLPFRLADLAGPLGRLLPDLAGLAFRAWRIASACSSACCLIAAAC